MSSSTVVVGSLSFDMVFKVSKRPLKGETVKGTSFETFVGGKGNNQALAAARAGSSCAMIGKVGDDEYGKLLRAELIKNKVNVDGLAVDKSAGTGLANIYVDDDGDNSIVIVPRANDTLKRDDIDRVRSIIEAGELILLQLEIPMETVVYTAQLAKKLGKKVLLNPAPAPDDGKIPDELFKSLDYFVPNESEAALIVGFNLDSEVAEEKALSKLSELIDGVVLITLGDRGVIGIDNTTGERVSHPAYKVNTIDTTAAGDAFIGAFASRLVENASLKEAVKYAAASGALATTVAGATPSLPDRRQIEALVSNELAPR